MTIKKIITALLLTTLFIGCKEKESKSSGESLVASDNANNNNSSNNNQASNPKDLLVNTWKITGSQFVGEDMTSDFNHISIELNKDGRATAFMGGETMNGTYTVNDDGNSFTMIDDENKKHYFEILEHSKNSIKVVTTSGGPTHTFTAVAR